MICIRNFFPIVCLLLTLCSWSSLQAQFHTNVKLNKTQYFVGEGVEATITIVNRSGSDVLLGAHGNRPWLNFTVYSPRGERSPSVDLDPGETVTFKAGHSMSRKVLLSRYFDFNDYGDYAVVANVYHPRSGEFYQSNRVRASFNRTAPFWEQSFGVPKGQPGEGQVRRYTLNVLRLQDHIQLYTRVLTDRTMNNIATFSLGSVIMVVDPQVAVDSENRLNVLFMTVPRTYCHVVVDPQGKVYRRNYYRDTDEDRPRMQPGADGQLQIVGGVPYNPEMEAQIQSESKTNTRSIGDRPPGL